jgi:phosphoenolpyruvate carboxykinase (ATP)
VNTGWSGGPYGVGRRIKLAYTRAIMDGIHTGHLVDAPSVREHYFGLDIVTECPGVPKDILVPKETWSDPSRYEETARKLATLFRDNFKSYADGVSDAVLAAGPTG